MGLRGRMLVALGGVASLALGAGGAFLLGPMLMGADTTVHVIKAPLGELRLERSERAYPLSGVIEAGGVPLDDAIVTVGTESVTTGEDGVFSFEHVPLGTITVTRPAYEDLEYQFDGSVTEIDLSLEPVIVKALFAGVDTLGSDTRFQALLDITATTTVNGLVFEVKDDINGGWVYYDSQVPGAINSDSVRVKYDITARLQQAQDVGLYTIARIPAFQSTQYTDAFPEHQLPGADDGSLDPRNPEAWEYPLQLATEVCGYGFDEIQFDYVRFPGHYPHSAAPDQAGRVENIRGFLEAATNRLHPLGCAVSADTFGWIQVQPGDEGIGQKLEETTTAIDVNTAMIYPGDWAGLGGSIGVNDPPANPHDTVGAILDVAMPRTAPGVVTRPFLQTSGYASSGVLRQIEAAEERGLGWILWDFTDLLFYVGILEPGTIGRG